MTTSVDPDTSSRHWYNSKGEQLQYWILYTSEEG